MTECGLLQNLEPLGLARHGNHQQEGEQGWIRVVCTAAASSSANPTTAPCYRSLCCYYMPLVRAGPLAAACIMLELQLPPWHGAMQW